MITPEQQAQVDRVRAEIGKVIYELVMIGRFGKVRESFNKLLDATQETWKEEAALFLRIPGVEIRDENQKFPEFLTVDGISEMELVNATRKSLKDNNWVKVIPKEK